MSAQQPPEKLGKYKIVRELGKGAMGVVYEGIDPIIGRRVAIKTARRDVMEASGRADEMMQRFLREARAAGMLNDPGIITIYDADEEDGIAYIAMEFIDSGNLQDYLARRGRPSPEEAVEIGAQICKALALAHAQGIVHRDIKPANIMMLSDGTVKIADFGIAHVSDSNLTQEGAMIGTPHYMSPEQFMGHKIDGRSDLFSVALIVYEMLTGEKPFTGEVLSTVMHKVIKVDPVEPKELNFAVNECLSKVIMKALSKNPAQRYPTGVAMAAALMEALKDRPDPAITGVGPCGRPAPSNDATVMAAESDATVVSSHLPDGGAAGAVGPQRSAAATPTIALGGQPSSQPARPATQSKRRLAVPAAVGAGVLAIVIAAGGFFMYGRSEPAVIEKIDFQVWLADTKEAFDAATDGDFTKCSPDGVADIRVIDRKTGETLADESKVDSVRTQLTKPSQAIQVVFKQPGYIETKREYSATKAKDVCKDVVVLRKEGL